MSTFNKRPIIASLVWTLILLVAFAVALSVAAALYPPFATYLENFDDKPRTISLFVFALSQLLYQAFSSDPPKKDRYYDAARKSKRNSNYSKRNAVASGNGLNDSLSWGALGLVLGLGGIFGVALVFLPGIMKSEKKAQSAQSELPTTAYTKPVSKAKLNTKYDAAVAIKDRVTFYADSRFPHLTTEDYKKSAGDLARIQFKMLKNRAQAKNYPTVLIGNGSWRDEACNEGLPTLGLYQYGRDCNELITVNFEAGNLNYEYQIEVLVTLAHEWGHHLINLSGENISGINNELLADCFAGVYLAYLDKYDAITEKEVRDTVKMMSQIGNTHGTGIHGTPAQRVNGLLSGAMFFDNPSDPQNQENWNSYCKGLEDVIDVRKPLP